ncbi:MAG: wax ester/triacylglycerol synthase family O-acyltransferase [Gammaproteobacteria bacterium]|nr:wax ester/triacylglycerol synthase family O-acyltransferase [Gammaproteobacteria bacterium]
MQQLNAQDAQFLYVQTSNNLTHVMSVSIYDPTTAPGGKVRFKDIISHIEARLDTSPVFKRRLMRLPLDFDYPYWVEDEYFDIEHHLFHGRLPEPGNWRQFCIHLSRHFSRPMDMNRPLWDMYVIEGLDHIEGVPSGSYAIATRVHHATIDGASATHFFSAISDMDAAGTPAIPLPSREPDLGQAPAGIELVRRAVGSNIRSPGKMASTALRFTPALFDVLQKRLSGDARATSKVPTTRFNQLVSPHKMFDAVSFDLADLKRIKGLVEGATINDVVLAICAGGLRRYLTHHDELPVEPLVANAPINARTSKREAETPGNNITAMTVPLPTHVADAQERLQRVRDITEQTKAAKAGISARVMVDITKHMPGATLAAVSRLMVGGRFLSNMCNLFISNVPGPQQTLYMNGARVVQQLALAPLADGMGLFIATPSYDGKMSFNIISTREIMPDIEFFRACIQQAFDELLPALPKRPRPVKRARARKRARPKSA